MSMRKEIEIDQHFLTGAISSPSLVAFLIHNVTCSFWILFQTQTMVYTFAPLNILYPSLPWSPK